VPVEAIRAEGKAVQAVTLRAADDDSVAIRRAIRDHKALKRTEQERRNHAVFCRSIGKGYRADLAAAVLSKKGGKRVGWARADTWSKISTGNSAGSPWRGSAEARASGKPRHTGPIPVGDLLYKG